MLTGDTVAADRLTTEVLRRAPEAADPSQLLTLLARTFVRHAAGRPAGGRATGGGPGDAAVLDAVDVLAGLRPRARAATVLRRVEGWPASRVADALHLDRTVIARTVPRTPGLEAALEAVAERHSRPPDEAVRTVLAALSSSPATAASAAPAARVGAGTARLVHRPWTWRALAAAVALGLVVWVSALGRPPAPGHVDQTGAGAAARTGAAGRTLTLVDGTTLTTAVTDLGPRGWALGPDGDPPDDLEGLRMVETVRIDLEQAHAPLRIDTWPRSGAAVFAVLWCDLPVQDPNIELPSARLSIGGERVVLPCAGTHGAPPVRRLVPLPPSGGRGRTTALVSWSGDVPGRGRALLATYTEVGAGPPPVVAGSELAAEAARAVPPTRPAGAVVLDGTTPSYRAGGAARPVHHQRVRIGPGSSVTVWAGGAGEITVQVDGTVVTDDGDTAVACESRHAEGTRHPDPPPVQGAWRAADPELRDGRWLVYRPGRARELQLPAPARPPAGERREATVSVSTSLERHAWQVQVADAEPVVQDRSPLPVVEADATFPRWIGGHRLAAAWHVPNDGIPHPLTDPGLRPGRRFLLAGSPAGTRPGAPGVVEPHVATTRGPAELSVVADVADAFDERVWQPGDLLLRSGASTRNIRAGTGTGVLSVTAPAAVGDTAPSTLLAYEPVRWEEFDLAAAPPMGVSALLGAADVPEGDPGPGSEGPGTRPVVAGRWTSADLDEDGRLTIGTDLQERSWLRFTTEGPGRVRVLERGRPAVWLPDGWWTSWTARPVVTVVRVEGSGRAGVPGRPFELLVDGHDARFVVELLLRGDGDDRPPGPPETLGR